MAYSSTDIDYRTICGLFKEKDCGNYFEYRKSEGNFAGMPHEIFVGDGSTNGNQIRYGRVLKTVVYIVVDEDEYGAPVIEKWKVKPIWARIARGANFNACSARGMLPDDFDDEAY